LKDKIQSKFMNNWIVPDWLAPSNIKTLFTTREGGVSINSTNGDYASLNLAAHVGDDFENVAYNRALLRLHLPAEPIWLKQVHGVLPVWVDDIVTAVLEGDAALCRKPGTVCAVMVADCLPIFLCDIEGRAVGVIHAGWRGLAGGIIEQSVAAMQVMPVSLIAWLGPAIGPRHFIVGADVYDAFIQHDRQAGQAFTPSNNNYQKKWLVDIFLLARQRLEEIGLTKIYGGEICTFSDPMRFFSYRRDGKTGRMAALIWIE
jgi:YfiH family protein